MKDLIIKFKKAFMLWFRASRGYTMATTIIPYIFAIVLASKDYEIDWGLSFLGLIGVILAHLSVNLMDDYFDWKKGAVAEYKKLVNEGMQARTHKCFYLEENLITIDTLKKIIIAMDITACSIGLFIAYEVGFSVLIIAALAGLMGYFYSASPVKLSYSGFGEIAIAIIFGPLLMSGAYITAGGDIDEILILSSVIAGILIANIAHTHAIMDFKSDMKVGKKSLPTLLGSQENAIKAQAIFYSTAYILLFIGILTGIYPPISLLAMLTIPKSIALVKLMKSDEKTKKIWMGVMENWEDLEKEGSDWFMMRLYLSRNIMTEFILILAISYLLG